MKAVRFLGLLALLLAVPLIAYAVSAALQEHLTGEIRDALAKSFPEDGPDAYAHVTAEQWCTTMRAGIAEDATTPASVRSTVESVCSKLDTFHLMQTCAVIAVSAGLILVGVIGFTGWIARGRRTILFLTFSPLLHLTMLTLSALMILHAGLGITALYLGESTAIGRVHTGIIGALGLGALFGVASLIRAQFSVMSKATTTVVGSRLERAKHPALWAFVDHLAHTMGAVVPDAIVAGLSPNFYVTEAAVVCLDGRLTGRTMYVSLPLCRLFSPQELKAVLGHELAHYKGSDTRFGQRFYPIYRGANEGLVRLSQGFATGNEQNSVAEIVLWPAFLTLSFFLNSFSTAEREISRDRELAADATAASVTDPYTIALALVKVHAYSPVWTSVVGHMKSELTKGKQLINGSTLFASYISSSTETVDFLGNVAEAGPVHPTDSHPSLTQRLNALGIPLDELRQPALTIALSGSAIDLVGDPEALERQLTEVEQVLMVKRGEVQIPQTT